MFQDLFPDKACQAELAGLGLLRLVLRGQDAGQHLGLTGFGFLQDGFGPTDDFFRQAGQLSHFDAEAVARPASNDLFDENDVVAALFYHDIIVFYAVHAALQLAKFVIMGGKQRAGAQFFLIGHIFQHRSGDGHAVKGGGAAADLVQDQQTPPGGVAQDVGHLVHLHHKGGASGKQVVGGSHPGKHPVAEADGGACRWDKAATLGQNGNERHLPHKGGFARHIGAGNHINAVFLTIQKRVVRDKQLVLQNGLHHGMPALFDFDAVAVVHRGHDVVILLRRLCQRAKHVGGGNGLSRGLEPVRLGRDLLPHPGEALIFQRRQTFAGRKHLALQCLELGGDVALAVGERLLTNIIRRSLFDIRFGNFDIIAEHFVIAHPELGNAGALPLAGFDIGKAVVAAAHQIPQTVDLLVKAAADDSALPQGKGRLLRNGPVNEGFDIGEGIHRLPDLPQQRRLKTLQRFPHARQAGAHLPQCPQIPPVGGAVNDAGRDALDVVDARKQLFQPLPGHNVLQKRGHRLLPPLDTWHRNQRLFQPLPQHTGAHGGAGFVQHPQKAALFLAAAERFGELQIAAGSIVQLHKLTAAINLQPVDIGKVVFLCFMQIGKQTAHGADQHLLFRLRRLIGKLPDGDLPRRLLQKAPFPRPLHIGGKAVFGKRQQVRVAVSTVGQQQFTGRKASQLVADLVGHVASRKLSGKDLAGGNVAEAHPRAPGVPIHGADKIVAALVQHGAFGDGARGDLADDLPLNQPLCQRRILHLLADGHLIALSHQPPDIPFGAVEGHAAHGRPLRLAAVAARKRQIQFLRRRFCVVEKHLVKIAQPVHQNTVLIVPLDFEILLHHRRKAGSVFSLLLVLRHRLLHLSKQRPGRTAVNLRLSVLPNKSPVSPQMHQLKTGGAGGEIIIRVVAKPVDQNGLGFSHIPGVDLPGDAVLHRKQPVEPPLLLLPADRVGHLCRPGAGAAGIDERKKRIEPHPLQKRERFLKLRLGLARETHDDVGGDGEVGHHLPGVIHQLQIAPHVVAAVHGLQYPVTAALDGQMDAVADFSASCHGVEELSRGVLGMRGHKADAEISLHSVASLQELRKIGIALLIEPVGIDVLSQKGDVPVALRHKAPKLR